MGTYQPGTDLGQLCVLCRQDCMQVRSHLLVMINWFAPCLTHYKCQRSHNHEEEMASCDMKKGKKKCLEMKSDKNRYKDWNSDFSRTFPQTSLLDSLKAGSPTHLFVMFFLPLAFPCVGSCFRPGPDSILLATNLSKHPRCFVRKPVHTDMPGRGYLPFPPRAHSRQRWRGEGIGCSGMYLFGTPFLWAPQTQLCFFRAQKLPVSSQKAVDCGHTGSLHPGRS